MQFSHDLFPHMKMLPPKMLQAAEVLSVFLDGHTPGARARAAILTVRRLCETHVAHIGLEVPGADASLLRLVGKNVRRFKSVAIPALYKGSTATVTVIPGTPSLELFEVRWSRATARRRESVSHIGLRVKTETGVQKIASLLAASFPKITLSSLLYNPEEGSLFFYARNERGEKLEFVYS